MKLPNVSTPIATILMALAFAAVTWLVVIWPGRDERVNPAPAHASAPAATPGAAPSSGPSVTYVQIYSGEPQPATCHCARARAVGFDALIGAAKPSAPRRVSPEGIR